MIELDGAAAKKIGVKIFDSDFFRSRSIHGKIPCRTSVLRFDRIFPDDKKAAAGKNLLSCDSTVILLDEVLQTEWLY